MRGNLFRRRGDVKRVFPFVVIVLVCLAARCVAEDLQRSTPAGSTPQQMGVGTETATSAKFRIPKSKESAFRFPSGQYILPGSLSVSYADGKTTFRETASTSAKSGEYRVLADSSILFSVEDAARDVLISWKYSPLRIALLPIVNQSNVDYMPAVTIAAVTRALKSASFDLLPEAEVRAAITSDQISFDPVITGIGEVPSPERIARFAEKLNVARILLAVVGSGAKKTQGFVVIGAVVVPYEEDSAAAVNLSVVMYDGATGRILLNKSKSGSKDLAWTNKRRAREKLVGRMVNDILSEYFGAATR
jgi:hypothetical protein